MAIISNETLEWLGTYKSYETEYNNLLRKGYLMREKLTKQQYEEKVKDLVPREYGSNKYKRAYALARESMQISFKEAQSILKRAKQIEAVKVKANESERETARKVIAVVGKKGRGAALQKNAIVETLPRAFMPRAPQSVRVAFYLSKSKFSDVNYYKDAETQERVEEMYERRDKYNLTREEDERMVADYRRQYGNNASLHDRAADGYFRRWAQKNALY